MLFGYNTDEMLWEPNFNLQRLASGNTGFIICHFTLKVVEPIDAIGDLLHLTSYNCVDIDYDTTLLGLDDLLGLPDSV